MKLESQVVSLEVSKQLKEAGYKQIGLWWWDLKTNKLCFWTYLTKESGEYIVAPTVAELGEALPRYTKSYKTSGWYCDSPEPIHITSADTEANARAKTWLYLKKENLI